MFALSQAQIFLFICIFCLTINTVKMSLGRDKAQGKPITSYPFSPQFPSKHFMVDYTTGTDVPRITRGREASLYRMQKFKVKISVSNIFSYMATT